MVVLTEYFNLPSEGATNSFSLTSEGVAESDKTSILQSKEVASVYECSVPRSMTLLAEQYLQGRDVSRGYASNLRRTARKMAAAGMTVRDVDGDAVSAWLSSLRTAGLSTVSIASERTSAMTLLRFGIEVGLIDRPIRRVIKHKIQRPPTRAFSRNDLTDAVKRLSICELGAFRSGCPKNLWLAAWVAYVYETGARFSDAYDLRGADLVPGGVAWTQSKTGTPITKRLSSSTAGKLSTLISLSPDGTVFHWAISRRHAFVTIRRAFKQVGLEGGKTQWLRRSGATHCEIEKPGTAKAYLGQKTHGLAEKAYIDYAQMLPQMPAPPALE